MENLTFAQQGVLVDNKKEFEDLSKLISIEISSEKNSIVKSQLIETKFKVLQAIVNLEKQRRNIYPLQKI